MSIKKKRMRFANWIRTNFRKENTMKILFSDEKMFDIDGIYNSQNDRICAVNRSAADIKGDIRQKRKFLQKAMIWVGVCSKGVFPLVIFEDGTMDHDRYMKEVLPVALKFGNDMFPGRRCTAANGRIRQISRDFWKRDSEIGSGLWFRLISSKFRHPDLINVSVYRFPSGSGIF